MDATGYRPSTNVEDHRNDVLAPLMAFLSIPRPQQVMENLQALYDHPFVAPMDVGTLPNTPGGLPEQAGINEIGSLLRQ